jgi:hypothetical protein
VKVLAPGFFARGDTATPVKIGVTAVALNLALNVAFMVPLQHVGPALATSLAAIFNVGWLGVALARRGHLVLDVKARRRIPRMLLAAGAMGAALAGTQHALFAGEPHGMIRMAALAALGCVGRLTSAAAAWYSARIGGRSAEWSGEGQPANRRQGLIFPAPPVAGCRESATRAASVQENEHDDDLARERLSTDRSPASERIAG